MTGRLALGWQRCRAKHNTPYAHAQCAAVRRSASRRPCRRVPPSDFARPSGGPTREEDISTPVLPGRPGANLRQRLPHAKTATHSGLRKNYEAAGSIFRFFKFNFFKIPFSEQRDAATLHIFTGAVVPLPPTGALLRPSGAGRGGLSPAGHASSRGPVQPSSVGPACSVQHNLGITA